MATVPVDPATESEAVAWRKLADNMRVRANAARPGGAKDLLSRIADQFEKAAQTALRDTTGFMGANSSA